MATIRDRISERPIRTISTIIGIVTGLITIIVFGAALVTNINNYIVTNAELEAVEQRIIAKIQDEAVLTRSVYIAELIERKTKLNERMSISVTAGEVASIQEEIKTLNARIQKLRGN